MIAVVEDGNLAAPFPSTTPGLGLNQTQVSMLGHKYPTAHKLESRFVKPSAYPVRSV